MNKFLFFPIILLSTLYFLFFAPIASAALVPCGPDTGKPNCDFCDLITLVEKVFNFAIYDIAIPLVVIMIIWGGFVIMTAGDSTDKVAQGRKIIQAAIIGVVIVLGAWLIINEILAAIGGGSFKPWNFGEYTICGKKINLTPLN